MRHRFRHHSRHLRYIPRGPILSVAQRKRRPTVGPADVHSPATEVVPVLPMRKPWVKAAVYITVGMLAAAFLPAKVNPMSWLRAMLARR